MTATIQLCRVCYLYPLVFVSCIWQFTLELVRCRSYIPIPVSYSCQLSPSFSWWSWSHLQRTCHHSRRSQLMYVAHMFWDSFHRGPKGFERYCKQICVTLCFHTIPSSHTKSTALCSSQELTFLEFFAGQGRVWKAVRGDTRSAVGIDIEYWNKESSNPFDILTNAGLGFHP